MLPILKTWAGKCLTQIVAFLTALMALEQNWSANHCFRFLGLHWASKWNQARECAFGSLLPFSPLNPLLFRKPALLLSSPPLPLSSPSHALLLLYHFSSWHLLLCLAQSQVPNRSSINIWWIELNPTLSTERKRAYLLSPPPSPALSIQVNSFKAGLSFEKADPEGWREKRD